MSTDPVRAAPVAGRGFWATDGGGRRRPVDFLVPGVASTARFDCARNVCSETLLHDVLVAIYRVQTTTRS